MPAPVPYATDEDIYTLASLDFAALVPKANIWAEGHDGVIPASDPWKLTSASNDFPGSGIAPPMLIQFLAPEALYSSTGEYYAIDSLIDGDPHSLRVRRVGAIGTAGEAPGTATGLSGVGFRIPTLLPQILMASSVVDALFDIGYGTDRARSNLTQATLDQLRMLCCMIVLRDQYLNMATSMNEVGSGKSTFAAKSREYADRADRLAGAVNVKYAGALMNVTKHRVGRLYRL